MKSIRQKVAGAITIAVVVAITMPILFGEPRRMEGQSGGDSWRNVIYDFQTLITGIFAVVAAFLTVRQMQVTDKAAQQRHDELVASAKRNEKDGRERHDELVNLTVRKDRLIVERLLFPSFMQLRLERDYIRECFVELPPVESVADPAVQQFRDSSEPPARKPALEVLNIVSQPAWTDAAALLDGFTSFHLRKTIQSASNIMDQAHAIAQYIVPPRPSDNSPNMRPWDLAMRGKTVEELQRRVEAYNEAVTTMIDELDFLIPCLQKLGREYGLKDF